jgi:hypothetical protein
MDLPTTVMGILVLILSRFHDSASVLLAGLGSHPVGSAHRYARNRPFAGAMDPQEDVAPADLGAELFGELLDAVGDGQRRDGAAWL